MIEITIKSDRVQNALRRLAEAGQDMSVVMGAVAKMLETETDLNFSKQGRPKWLGLAPSTIRQRTREGKWPGMILSKSAAGLAASIVTQHDSHSAAVGVPDTIEYGAIHQFGGQAGRGKKVTIPARPFLPVDAQGNLQPEAEISILGIANNYLANLI